MATPTEKLYLKLKPEQVDTYLFKAPADPNHLGRIYGGQVLAQALNAASRTVPDERHAHSLHAYFLRYGDDKKPVLFHVEPLRDGGSFSTCHVVAKQDGKAILDASVSFKVPEDGHTHQPNAPEVPAPSALENDLVRLEAEGVPVSYSEINPFSTFDIRTVGKLPHQFEAGDSATQGMWIKTANPVVESVLMQQCLLAYASDFRMMCSATKPHGLNFWDDNVHCASLDHALWFHRPFRFDEWLYYDLNGPVSADGRGLNFGRFYDSSGQLIASTAQEGLMRVTGRA